jgi:hypothetical protein
VTTYRQDRSQTSGAANDVAVVVKTRRHHLFAEPVSELDATVGADRIIDDGHRDLGGSGKAPGSAGTQQPQAGTVKCRIPAIVTIRF